MLTMPRRPTSQNYYYCWFVIHKRTFSSASWPQTGVKIAKTSGLFIRIRECDSDSSQNPAGDVWKSSRSVPQANDFHAPAGFVHP
jgi:hypothetical protein